MSPRLAIVGADPETTAIRELAGTTVKARVAVLTSRVELVPVTLILKMPTGADELVLINIRDEKEGLGSPKAGSKTTLIPSGKLPEVRVTRPTRTEDEATVIPTTVVAPCNRETLDWLRDRVKLRACNDCPSWF